MRIRALETFLDGRDRFVEGDTRTVEKVDGEYFCDRGWAEHVPDSPDEVQYPTGERDTSGAVVLDIRNLTVGTQS